MEKEKLIYASAISAFTNAVFVVSITIVAELSAPVKSWLANLSGHHWTSKSIISVLLYLAVLTIVYLAVKSDLSSSRIRRSLYLCLGSVIAGSLIIFAFYVGHHLGFY
ncbi:MAG: hypothetical protein HY506_00185 [Candidatus Yanofskybacteria bacterium]|nr:hypothetical protein [Candidatus Yanofskybacteria bacterium]